MTNADMPAMPCQPLGRDGMPSSAMAYGLTKREMFAMFAMQGILSNANDRYTYEQLAGHAVAQADALLEKLEQAK